MSAAKWALLAPARPETMRQWVVEAPMPVRTITRDLRSALLLVGSGQLAGLAVLNYALLAPLVVELAPDPPGVRRPRFLPAEQWPGRRRPEVTSGGGRPVRLR